MNRSAKQLYVLLEAKLERGSGLEKFRWSFISFLHINSNLHHTYLLVFTFDCLFIAMVMGEVKCYVLVPEKGP